jgi:hypothetical protein
VPRPKKTLLSSQDTASTNGTVKGISGENGSAENEDMSAGMLMYNLTRLVLKI